MRILLFIAVLLLSPRLFAQMSVLESDSSNRFKLFNRSWGANFFSLASVETDKFNDQGGRLSTYNYLTLSAYISSDYRFALRLPFQYNSAGTDRFNGEKVNESDIFLQDVILGVQNYSLFALPFDLNLYWEGRVYLPTSENSQRTQLITRLRNDFILSKVLNRYIETEYAQKFSYFLQSRTAYENSFEDEYGFPVETTSLTKKTEIDHWVQVWGKITPQTGVGWKLGWEDTTWNKSKELNRAKPREKILKTGPSVRFPVTSSANFILSYEDKVDRDQNPGELGQFLAKNTSWVLLSFLKF